MPENFLNNKKSLSNIYRIIDANINRSKEGLRICEEIARFILNSRYFTYRLKQIRHKIDTIVKGLYDTSEIIRKRRSLDDVGFKIYINELKRANYKDIFFANMQRVKESVRVLEEFSKLKDKGCAIKFKELRYIVYELEKKITQKIASLRNH